MKNLTSRIGNKLKSIGKIRLLLLAIFSFTFLSSLVYLIGYGVNAYDNKQEMKKLAMSLNSGTVKVNRIQACRVNEKNIPQKPVILPQFKKLYDENQDIIGWINIDGTNINYPVMFTPGDGEYYLHRNFQKKPENRGLPFLDRGTDIMKSSNYLIYGHNMKDGTAFAGLNAYRSQSYFLKHPIIHFDTIYAAGDYKIMGVLLSKVYNQNEDVFKYYKFNYPATDKQYESFITNVKKNSLYETGVTAKPGEQLLTLSTCSYHTQNGRLAVVAKKIS